MNNSEFGHNYSKITLILKKLNPSLLTEGEVTKNNDEFTSRIKIEYENSSFMITGNYVIINTNSDNGTIGALHDIATIHSYKLCY